MDPMLLDEIITGIERAKGTREWREANGQFIPYASTWLNRFGWQDEYTPAAPIRESGGARDRPPAQSTPVDPSVNPFGAMIGGDGVA